MEQCFRIALWMFLLIGCLQAKPVTSGYEGPCFPFSIPELSLSYLLEELSCDQNMTFTSPVNMEKSCYNATMQYFTEGLLQAVEHCIGDKERPDATWEALQAGFEKLNLSPDTQKNTSECPGKKEQFTVFVDHIRSFAESVNSNSSETC